ncbi:DNA translocase FtsK [Spiroplasma endosymbiont of Labia minor]|uniref:DNA translocase FtsK n=1 Tax=Spiroplasma endosymbiont of Labia minor TaxID=3066305 RepID=UPI0030D0D404
MDKNDDRTTAFVLEQKQRRSDNISWIIISLLMFVFVVISVGRITIVGQFLDDVLFTLPFGWFKYIIYLAILVFVIAAYFGIRFKFKKRFLGMVISSSLILSTLISSILIIVAYYTKTKEFQILSIINKDMLKNILIDYWKNWQDHSIFSLNPDYKVNFIYSEPSAYFTIYAGGGLFGNLFAGIFAYTSIFGGLVISLFFVFVQLVWILTGDPIYLFRPKSKQRGRGLRILSLSSNSKEKKVNNHSKWFRTININSEDELTSRQVLDSLKESDITFEFPSYVRSKQHSLYSPVEKDYYESDVNYDDLLNKFPERNVLYEEKNYNDYNESFGGYENVNSINNNRQNKMQSTNYENQQYEYRREKMNDSAYYSNNIQQQQNNYENNQKLYKPRTRNQQPLNENLNYTIPATTKYGDIDPAIAREKFGQETAVTPFGANGKTQELMGVLKNEPNSRKDMHQVTIDEYITNHQDNEKIKQREKRRIERSPMYDSFNTQTRILNGVDVPRNTLPIKVNSNLAENQEQYINNSYQLPSLDLLKKVYISPEDIQRNNAAADAKVDVINRTFVQFKINAQVVNYVIGPTVTKFEVQPGDGTKVNSILGLENDLKLTLATQNVLLEAPIQGKALVGIEIPNDYPSVVSLRELMEKIPIQKINSKLLFAIGKNVLAEPIIAELDKLPHLLVAGSTGSGKSVMINAIITSILLRAKPHEVKFLMIDPKKVELSMYNNLPHLLAPVISDMKDASNALKKVIEEMERRYSLFTMNNVKNIEGYNRKQTVTSLKIPYIVIVIDELADLMLTANKRDVEESIMRLTQMARASGIHLIVATQRPSTDVITGVIKTNIPSRISFAVSSGIDSRTILDSIGAEKLIGRGDLLFMPAGSSNLTRAQGAFLSDDEIERIVSWITNQQQASYDPSFMQKETNSQDVNSSSSNDEMYEQIKEFVIREQKASTSLLQRKFQLGYNRAARIIDELEAEGIIGPQNGSKPREVFLRYEDIY